jgi:hypothetical protein
MAYGSSDIESSYILENKALRAKLEVVTAERNTAYARLWDLLAPTATREQMHSLCSMFAKAGLPIPSAPTLV